MYVKNWQKRVLVIVFLHNKLEYFVCNINYPVHLYYDADKYKATENYIQQYIVSSIIYLTMSYSTVHHPFILQNHSFVKLLKKINETFKLNLFWRFPQLQYRWFHLKIFILYQSAVNTAYRPLFSRTKYIKLFEIVVIFVLSYF